MKQAAEYGIEDLARLGGVSRRTVRYYVQEGLLPVPLGVGRGRHYGAQHLERLVRVRGLQERGLSLDEIRRTLAGRPAAEAEAAPRLDAVAVEREPWVRLHLGPGVELHVSGEVRLPPPGRLAELAEWCRRNLRREGDDE